MAGYYYPKLVLNFVKSYGYVWMCRVVGYRKKNMIRGRKLQHTLYKYMRNKITPTNMAGTFKENVVSGGW